MGFLKREAEAVQLAIHGESKVAASVVGDPHDRFPLLADTALEPEGLGHGWRDHIPGGLPRLKDHTDLLFHRGIENQFRLMHSRPGREGVVEPVARGARPGMGVFANLAGKAVSDRSGIPLRGGKCGDLSEGRVNARDF